MLLTTPALKRDMRDGIGTAVCLAGEPRSLALPCVHKTLRDRFLEPLFASQKKSALLLLLRRDQSNSSGVNWIQGDALQSDSELRKLGTPSTAYQQREPPSEIKLKRAIEYLRDTKGLNHFVSQSINPGGCGRELAPPCKISGAASPSTDQFLAQQVAWDACLTAIEELEASRGERFATIVRTRPDLWWEANVPLPRELLLLGHQRAILPARYDKYRASCEQRPPGELRKPYLFASDWLIAIKRSLAHRALGWLRDFCEQCKSTGAFSLTPPKRQHIFTTEGLLATRLSNASVVPLRASIVRAWSQNAPKWFSEAQKRSFGEVWKSDIRAMSQFAKWAGVSCGELDNECFQSRLRGAGFGWCTENSGRRVALQIDQACGYAQPPPNASWSRRRECRGICAPGPPNTTESCLCVSGARQCRRGLCLAPV